MDSQVEILSSQARKAGLQMVDLRKTNEDQGAAGKPGGQEAVDLTSNTTQGWCRQQDETNDCRSITQKII